MMGSGVRVPSAAPVSYWNTTTKWPSLGAAFWFCGSRAAKAEPDSELSSWRPQSWEGPAHCCCLSGGGYLISPHGWTSAYPILVRRVLVISSGSIAARFGNRVSPQPTARLRRPSTWDRTARFDPGHPRGFAGVNLLGGLPDFPTDSDPFDLHARGALSHFFRPPQVQIAKPLGHLSTRREPFRLAAS